MSLQLRIASILAIVVLAAAWGLLRSQNVDLERSMNPPSYLGEKP